MKPKIPSYFLVAAVAIVGASIFAKKLLLFRDTLGRSDFFERGCAISSSICIAIALLLALHGLATQPTKRRYFYGIHFCAVAMLCAVVGAQFFAYVAFTKTYNQLNSLPNVLPKFIENARMADSEIKRQKIAQGAYKLYGVTIVYRRDNGDLADYEPTAADIAFQKDFAQTSARNHELMEEIIGGQLKQYPSVIAMEVGSFFFTLLLGNLLVAFRKTPTEPGEQS